MARHNETWTPNVPFAGARGGSARIIPRSRGAARAMLRKRVTAEALGLRARHVTPAIANTRLRCRKDTGHSKILSASGRIKAAGKRM
jgi:hypothetical protein